MWHRFSSRLRGGTRTFTALLLSCLLVSCGESVGPKRPLQFTIAPTDSFILYLSGNWTLDTFLPDAPVTYGGRSEAAYRFEVKSIDSEGNVEFKVTAESVVFPSLIATLGPALKGETFTMHMAPDGSISGFEGTETLRKNVSAKIDRMWGDSVDPNKSAEQIQTERERFRDALVGKVGDEEFKGLFECVFRVWPPMPVTQGDAWQIEDVAMFIQFGGFYGTREITVKSWKMDEVVLSSKAQVKTLVTDPLNQLSGTTESEITLDGANGYIKTVNTISSIEGTYKSREGTPSQSVTVKQEVFAELLRL